MKKIEEERIEWERKLAVTKAENEEKNK